MRLTKEQWLTADSLQSGTLVVRSARLATAALAYIVRGSVSRPASGLVGEEGA